jgi:hypothetical protein
MAKTTGSWRLLAPLLLAACCPAIEAQAADNAWQSGLQSGDEILAIFEPLNVTGPYAGEPHCLVCENGANPVVMVFARRLTEPVIRLLAKIDAATAKHRAHDMGSFAVFLDDDEQLAARLKQTAEKQSLQQIVLATDSPAGPDGFKLAAEAEVTVVLYREHKVIANHAFRKAELNDDRIEKILADIPRIVKEK